METRQLNFDVARGGVQHRLFVRAGDVKSRTIIAKMYSGDKEIPFSAASIRVLGADGASFLSECAVSENTATYTLTTEDIGEGGEVLCEFVLYGEDGAVMTSPRFAVVCEKLLYTDEAIESSDEYQAYVAALMKIDNLSVNATASDASDASATVSSNSGGGIHIDLMLPRGKQGEKGYTPQRGADYWTEEDIAEIKSYVDNAILGGEW